MSANPREWAGGGGDPHGHRCEGVSDGVRIGGAPYPEVVMITKIKTRAGESSREELLCKKRQRLHQPRSISPLDPQPAHAVGLPWAAPDCFGAKMAFFLTQLKFPKV